MNPLLLSPLIIFLYQNLWFALAVWRKRNDFADIAWGLGFVVLGVANWLLAPAPHSLRATLVLALVTLWGIRLALHIGLRATRHDEDARYKAMRKAWNGNEAWNSYIKVFMLQGILLVVVGLPVILGVRILKYSAPVMGFVDFLGIFLFLAGLMVETIADRQLSQFVKTKKPGQVLQSGLWKFSRHPNYFGEILLWWALALIVCGQGAWLSLLGPMTLSFLILKVSGIPMLEKRYAGNPEFELYKKRTSVFFPWFQKIGGSS